MDCENVSAVSRVEVDGSEAGCSSSYVEERVSELASAVDGRVVADHQLYYVCVVFDDEPVGTSTKTRVIRELENATDVQGSIPNADQVCTSDTTVELLLVTALSPEDVVSALDDRVSVDGVSLWELDVDELDVDVVRKSENDGRAGGESVDVVEEFDRLREEFDRESGREGVSTDTDRFEFTTPEDVEFSDDEITFDELVAVGQDEPASSREKHEHEGDEPSSLGERWTSSSPSESAVDGGPTDEGQRDSLLAVLASELEGGVANTEDLEVLREHVESDRSRTSIEVRVDHVQSRIDSLCAYTAALEEFLDEEGTAEELIDGFRTDVNTLRTELENVQAALEEAADEREGLRADLDALSAAVPTEADVAASFERLERALELEREASRIRTDAVGARLEDVTQSVEEQARWQRRLEEAIVSDRETVVDSRTVTSGDSTPSE